MSDKAIDLDGIVEVFRGIADPALDRGQLRPAVERCIQLDGIESRDVMLEPRVGARGVRVKDPAPMPVEPAGATDVNLHASP